MADILDINSTEPVRIIGADLSGAETTPVKATPNQDLGVADVLDNGGLDAILSLTMTPVEGKVGATVKANRKYFIMEAQSTNVKWGFSNTTQSFDLFKSQLLMIPCGPNTQIWFKMSTGTGSVAIGEVS